MNEDKQEHIILEDSMLTTIDNPFNPKEHYDQWRNWDLANGYNTEALIARLYEQDLEGDDYVSQQRAMDSAIQLILDTDVLELYKLI